MRQTKFYILISTSILSLSAFVMTKASTKFAQFNQACFRDIGGLTISAPGSLTSVKGVFGRTLWLATRVVVITHLHTAVTITTKSMQLYLK